VIALLRHLVSLPLAPARVASWSVGQVVGEARRQYASPEAVRRELAALSQALDRGLISAEEFDRREDDLLDRLEAGAR
jgi:Gas vesicle protein G